MNENPQDLLASFKRELDSFEKRMMQRFDRLEARLKSAADEKRAVAVTQKIVDAALADEVDQHFERCLIAFLQEIDARMKTSVDAGLAWIDANLDRLADEGIFARLGRRNGEPVYRLSERARQALIAADPTFAWGPLLTEERQ